MNTSKNDLSPSEIEQLLYESDQFLDGIFPQSEVEVSELQTMFGTTPVELPERLRDSKEVLERILKKEDEAPKSTAFGKLIKMLRTEKKLSIESLANKVDLNAQDLQQLESGHTTASPLVATVLAEYFKLQPQKVIQIAGLTRESVNPMHESLYVAACAKPNFDALTSDEKNMFHAFVKQLRTKDKQ